MSLLPTSGGSTAGLQGQERSGAKVEVYNRAGSVFYLATGNQVVDFNGRVQDGVPPLLSVSCQNSLSSGGRFSFVMHMPEGVDACSLVEPDAWCDISWYRFKTSWHVMRGMVDEVRVRRETTGSGVTVVTATVSGRSFQKAWETTPCWFNQFNGANFLPTIASKITGTGQVNSTPSANIENILLNFFDFIGTVGRNNWAMPRQMPGKTGSVTEAVLYDDDLLDKKSLRRQTIRGDLFFPDVNLWGIATQHYADSQFCELFTDILPSTGLRGLANDPEQDNGLSTAASRMAICFRDKPFPLVDPQASDSAASPVQPSIRGPYFRLPLWTLPAQAVRSTDLGTSSYEAFNAFMTVNAFDAEQAAGFGVMKNPLWSVGDMQRRGMRRLDASSPYVAYAPTSPLSLMLGRRARLRDWYCLGPELRQGSLQLWRVHPQVRVGGRVRVRGGAGPEDDLTGYVESVRHQWNPQGGASTAIDFTRGWLGTDADLIRRLGVVSRGYTIAPSKPG